MDAQNGSIGDMTWWAYVRKHQGADANATTGRKVGISGSAVGRWKSSTPDPAQASAFARAYGRPVLEAFIAAGFLTPEEAGEKPSAAPSLASLDDDDLLDEVRRRMKGGSDAGTTREKIAGPGEPGELTRDDVDLAARRGRNRGAEQQRQADEAGTESQDSGGMEPA